MKRYRTVENYGYGDVDWTNRMLTLREIVEFYKERGWDITQIRSAFRDYSHFHYWEEDKISDQLDLD